MSGCVSGRPQRALIVGMVTGTLSLWGCGQPTTQPAQTVQTVQSLKPVVAEAGLAADAAESAQASADDPGDPRPTADVQAFGISAQTQAELDLFAFATLHVNRIKTLQDSSVQRQLQLTPEQIKTVTDLKGEMQRIAKELQAQRPEDREEKLRNDFTPRAREFQRIVDELLNDEQERIVFQRTLQNQRGAVTFLLPGVAERLGLTATQRATLYRLIDDTRRETDWDKLANNNPLEIAKLLRRVTAARKAAEDQLTPEQKARWNALLGR